MINVEQACCHSHLLLSPLCYGLPYCLCHFIPFPSVVKLGAPLWARHQIPSYNTPYQYCLTPAPHPPHFITRALPQTWQERRACSYVLARPIKPDLHPHHIIRLILREAWMLVPASGGGGGGGCWGQRCACFHRYGFCCCHLHAHLAGARALSHRQAWGGAKMQKGRPLEVVAAFQVH